MLTYKAVLPTNPRAGAPVLLLLHGRGSDEHDLATLIPHLMPEAMGLSLRAPFPGEPWGYGPGWAWYEYMGRNRPEPEGFSKSLEALDELIDRLEEILPARPGPLVMGGFSQGGTVSLAYALRSPGRVSAALNFSGFLPDHPAAEATPESVAGTRFFWGHGSVDPAIPFELAVEGRAALEKAGADLTVRDYSHGHTISPGELRDAAAWLASAGQRGVGAAGP